MDSPHDYWIIRWKTIEKFFWKVIYVDVCNLANFHIWSLCNKFLNFKYENYLKITGGRAVIFISYHYHKCRSSIGLSSSWLFRVTVKGSPWPEWVSAIWGWLYLLWVWLVAETRESRDMRFPFQMTLSFLDFITRIWLTYLLNVCSIGSGKVTYTLVKLGDLPSPISKHPLNGKFIHTS